MTVSVAPEATPPLADRRRIGRGLAQYNRARGFPAGQRERWVMARDAAGALAGGARCRIASHWLYLDWLWVAEARRGGGLGTRLLAAVEALARAEGCVGVHLDTLTFQAPGFYAKLGYRELARLEDMPPGAACHWFAKRLEG